MFRRTASFSFIGLMLFSAFFSLLVILTPQQAAATETESQDKERRLLVAFRHCMGGSKIDGEDKDNKPAEDFRDMWQDDGEAYFREDIVVGFELEKTNGVKSCRSSLLPGMKLIGERVNSIEEAEERLLEILQGSTNSEFLTKRVELIGRANKAINDMGKDPRRAFTAVRLVPLVRLCYKIQDYSPSTNQGGEDFSATLAGKKYNFTHKTNADDDDYPWLDQGGGGIGQNDVKIGDIKLGFMSGNDGVGASNWDSYKSDFYPFGSDLPSFTDGYAGNNGILDCVFIKKNIGFFTDDVVMGVNTSTDTINIGLDTDGDGRPDQQLNEVEAPAGTTGENKPTCESEGWTLSWIICPLIYMGDAVLRKLDQALIGLLSVPNDYYQHPGLKNAWSRLRNIAYFLLVPVILVMVIGTALGFEFVSAYTVKRALPRLIAATIFIALSYEICKFLIIMTNDVSRGIHGLIISAFVGSGGNVSLASIFSPDGGDSALGLGFGAIAGAGALAAGSIGIILSFIFVGIVGLAIGFFLLSLRQMLIVALMILAPVAILSWIFPGNDKLWKLWWNSFSKLLLLFPLIMILVAVGKSFASIASVVDSSFVTTLIKLIAYVGPYFLIPAMFKFAGGIFATVSGMANDRNRGLFDRQKKYRGAKMSENWGKTQTGQKFKGSNRVTGRLNRIGMGATSGIAGGFGLGQRGRIAADEMTMTASDEQMKSQAWRGNMFKDNAMRALTYENETDARAGLMARGLRGNDLEEALTTAKRIGYGRTSQIAASRQLAMNKTGYDDAADAMDTVQRVAGKNGILGSSLKENIKYTSKGVGRNDLGALSSMNEIEMRSGEEGRQAWNDRMTVEGAQTADAATLARNHSKSVGNISDATKRIMNRAHGSNGDGLAATPSDVSAAGKVAGAMKEAESYATLGNTGDIDTAAGFADRQPTGRTRTDKTGGYRVTPGDDGELIVTPETRTSPESLLDANSRRIGNPNDPNAPAAGPSTPHED